MACAFSSGTLPNTTSLSTLSPLDVEKWKQKGQWHHAMVGSPFSLSSTIAFEGAPNPKRKIAYCTKVRVSSRVRISVLHKACSHPPLFQRMFYHRCFLPMLMAPKVSPRWIYPNHQQVLLVGACHFLRFSTPPRKRLLLSHPLMPHLITWVRLAQVPCITAPGFRTLFTPEVVLGMTTIYPRVERYPELDHTISSL